MYTFRACGRRFKIEKRIVGNRPLPTVRRGFHACKRACASRPSAASPINRASAWAIERRISGSCVSAGFPSSTNASTVANPPPNCSGPAIGSGRGKRREKRWRCTRHAASKKRYDQLGGCTLSMTRLPSRSRKPEAAPTLNSQENVSSTPDPSRTAQKVARSSETRRGSAVPRMDSARTKPSREVASWAVAPTLVDSSPRSPSRLSYSPLSAATPGVTSALWRPALCRYFLMADFRVLKPRVALRVRLPTTSLPISSTYAP